MERQMKKGLISLSLLLILLTFFGSKSFASPRLIASGAGDQNNPAIFGNKIVYETEMSEEIFRIFIKDLKTGKQRALYAGPAGQEQMLPDIYKNRAVWVSEFPGADLDKEINRPQIWQTNLTKWRSSPLPIKFKSDDLISSLALSTKKMAYILSDIASTNESLQNQLYLYDFASKRKVKMGYNVVDCDMTDDKIVWSKMSTVSSTGKLLSSIFLKELRSGKTKKLLSERSANTNPVSFGVSISGDNLVYTRRYYISLTKNVFEIWRYNLKTGVKSLIKRTTGQHFLSPADIYYDTVIFSWMKPLSSGDIYLEKIDVSAPVINLAVSTNSFCPVTGEVVTFSYTLNEPAKAEIKITSPSGKVSRVLSKAAEEGSPYPLTFTLTWNGKDAAGSLLPPGSYSFSLSATDIYGNRAQESTGSISIIDAGSRYRANYEKKW